MGIRAIGANIVQKVKSPLIQRKHSSNPFERNDFSGKVFKNSILPVDVFQTNKTNKMKMMSASVVGAVSNFGHKISQPIVNFAKNVKTRVNNTISAIKSLPQKVSEMRHNMSEKISEKLNLHKEEPANGVKVLSMKHINTKASIEDLKTTWLEENKLEMAKKSAKEAA